ncbi:MAG TPA: hypothetical protein VF739_13660 [Ktedonobacterales bacterium]
MAEWVVRAGEAAPEKLVQGYDEHRLVPGLFGFSVQYEPGKSVDELARAGRFLNAKISFAYDSDLAASLLPLGYSMRLLKTPGSGYHVTFVVLYDATGQMLEALPDDAARAISAAFQRKKNPFRATR